MPLTSPQIDEIVHSVLKQLQSTAAPAVPTAATPKAAVSAVPVQAASERAGAVVLTDKVITAERLQGVTVGQRIVVPARAIITPSARDLIKQGQLKLEHASSPANQPKTAAGQAVSGWLGLTVETSAAWDIAAKSVRQAGLAEINWQLADSTETAAETAISESNRGSGSGVLIVTDRVATAVCLANRHERVRAAGMTRVSDLSILDELKPNVVCLPSRGVSHADAMQLLRRILVHSR